MTRRTLTLWALAAGLAVGNAAYADDQPGRTTDQPGAGAGGAADTGRGERMGGMEGQQTDQQITQQLRQFAQDPKTAADKLFLLSAAIDSQWEHQFSQQVQQKSQDQQVKQLAQRITRDHEKMNQHLQDTAKALNVTIPQGLPSMKQQELQILTSMPADQLDKIYVAKMQASHAKAVSSYQSAAQILQDDKAKQFASKQLPLLQEHWQETQRTATALGLPSGVEAVPAGSRTPGGSDRTTPGGDRTTPGGDRTTPGGERDYPARNP